MYFPRYLGLFRFGLWLSEPCGGDNHIREPGRVVSFRGGHDSPRRQERCVPAKVRSARHPGSAVFVDLNVPRWFKSGSKLLQNIHHRHDNTNLSTDLHCSLRGGDWLANKNRVVSWKAVTRVDLRSRSDTNNANRSPQTTILPALR